MAAEVLRLIEHARRELEYGARRTEGWLWRLHRLDEGGEIEALVQRARQQQPSIGGHRRPPELARAGG